MRKKIRLLLLTISVLHFCTPAKAQFYVTGQSETSLRWSYILTDNYKVIYPEGLDSLGRAYAVSLESVRPAVGTSVGMLANEQYRRRMPVVLLTQKPDANGLVVWAPRRMELQTTPDAYNPEAMEWMPQLTIHETRHASQMQFSNRGKWKFFHFLSGEALTGLLDGLYTSSLFLEGDAVVAETGLSRAGRGRSAEFLEYYRTAWMQGDKRDWHKWRYGSLCRYTPNKYVQGYVAYAGTRYRAQDGFVAKNYFDDLLGSRWPFPNNSEFKYIGGDGKKIKPAFQDVSGEFVRVWNQNDSLRGNVFMHGETVVPEQKFYTYFEGTVWGDGKLYAICRGKGAESRLVSIDSAGVVKRLSQWGASTSKLDWSNGRLYWSESIDDVRWENKGTSRIRTIGCDGKGARDITTKGRYYNPAVRGDIVAASKYTSDGLSHIALLSAEDGRETKIFHAPEGLQVLEPVWVEDELFTSAVTKNGYGIYAVSPQGIFKEVLAPQAVRAKNLRSVDREIWFTSDRTTVNELYALNVITGSVNQMTATRFGASDFATDGTSLYYSECALEGKPVRKLRIESLPVRHMVDYSEVMTNEIAENLSSQEAQMGSCFRDPGTISISEPRHYSKVLHALKIHSWAPIYLNYDEAEQMSFSINDVPVNLGATAFFQNDLSTLYGGVGVSLMNSRWDGIEPQGHIYLTYAGLMPKFKLEFNFGGEHRNRYSLCHIASPDSIDEFLTGNPMQGQSWNGSLTSFLPLSFNKGGWYKGVIPQISYSIANNFFDTAIYNYQAAGDDPASPIFTTFTGKTRGRSLAMQRISSSLRAYAVQAKPSSALFPRLGIGGQLGYIFRPGLSDKLTPTLYGTLYSYLPGFFPLHSVKFTMTSLKQYDAPVAESSSLALPTGFTSEDALALNAVYPNQLNAKLEYAFPFADLQWSFLEPLTYIRNLNLTLRAEGSILRNRRIGSTNLYSAGADLDASIGNLLMVRANMRIGMSWSYIGGAAWEMINVPGRDLSHNYFAPIFKIDF